MLLHWLALGGNFRTRFRSSSWLLVVLGQTHSVFRHCSAAYVYEWWALSLAFSYLLVSILAAALLRLPLRVTHGGKKIYEDSIGE